MLLEIHRHVHDFYWSGQKLFAANYSFENLENLGIYDKLHSPFPHTLLMLLQQAV